ncbi:MAG: radical SAM protein [Bacteroidales bacterium]|nr:radical SAM protein [Bacteroidales bacterium]
MKYSIFNNRLRLSENADIIYNALSEKYIIIRKNASLPLLYSDENKDEINTLTSMGFIVPDNKKEIEEALGIFLKSSQNDNYFKLTINPTLRCNFRCWYCYEDHKNNSNMNEETFNAIKSLIDKLTDRYHKLELAFFGGEPILEFSRVVLPLIQYTKEISYKKGKEYIITFTTNGYLFTPEIIRKLSLYNIGVSQITLDGGPLSHNETRKAKGDDSFITIIRNIKELAHNGLPVLIRINVTQRNVKSALEIPEYFSSLNKQDKSNLTILVQQVWQDKENDILNEIWDIYEAFIKIGIYPWRISFNNLETICYADCLHSAVINYDGRVFKCTAIDFSKFKEDTTIHDNVLSSLELRFNERIQKRLSNKSCNSCRIYPICGGGCSKHVDQAADCKEYCLYPSEKDKDKMVKNIIYQILKLRKLGLR